MDVSAGVRRLADPASLCATHHYAARPMRTRLSAVVLLATIPLAVLVVDPFGWYPFGPAKFAAVSVTGFGGTALVLASRPVRLRGRTAITLGLFLVWLALAALVGFDPVYAWTGTPERRLGVITWLLCGLLFVSGHAIDVARDRVAMLGCLIATGLGSGSLAVAEAIGWEPSLFDVEPGRLTSTMGSAAFLGAVTVLLLPPMVGIAGDRELQPWVRGAAACAAAAQTVACVGAGARASWFGLAVAALVTVVARRRAVLADRARAALVATSLLVAFLALALLSPFGDRLASTADAGAAGGRSRVDEWRVAAAVVADHPVTGVGPEGYRIAFAEGVDDAYEQAYGRDPIPDRAHSAPLDVALAGGLPALAMWAALMVLMIGAAWRALRDGPLWLAGVAAGFVAHVAEQVLLFPTAELEPISWLLAGVLVATFPKAHPTAQRDAIGAAQPRPEHVASKATVAAAAAIAVAALAVGAVDVLADRDAHRSTEATGRGDTARAVRSARAAVARRPDEVRLHLLLGFALVHDQQGTNAGIAALNDALAISPGDPIVRRHRARLLVERAGATRLPADVTAARRDLDELTAMDPANAALWMLAGAAARLDADAPAAEAAFVRAETLAPRDASPGAALASLYLDTGRVEDARRAAERAVARQPDDAEAIAILDRANEAT